MKEIQAGLARVSAGLENIKADIILGKLTKGNFIRKRADAVIKDNGCQNIVNYHFDEATQNLLYVINEQELQEKIRSKIVLTWKVKGEQLEQEVIRKLNGISVFTDRFSIIRDQLRIPPMSIYVDYHYSPEIISGHIQLEIINQLIAGELDYPGEGVKL
ncbi:hypothetical protein N752_26140 [Desulforamulus aquiferis]|nr:hypothetical protein [Desulforamulus aquiferis]RYD02297.1 hypothetical protein N752_26140 [Desulforamulus aquiferis]